MIDFTDFQDNPLKTMSYVLQPSWSSTYQHVPKGKHLDDLWPGLPFLEFILKSKREVNKDAS